MNRFLISICVLLSCTYNSSAQTRFSYTREKMGSPFTIILYHTDSSHAEFAAEKSFHLVDSLVGIFSDYINESELNRLSKSAGSNKSVPVSPALYDIMRQSQKAHKMSKGAFDITIGPLARLWRTSRKAQTFPADSVVLNKREKVGFDKIIIDTVTKSVQLLKPGMQLDLGGIAQGYIGQKVLERLTELSIESALVDVSGDIILSDPPPGKKGWTLGVNQPGSGDELQKKNLVVHNCAVSTSGDVYQFIEHEGKRFSHIIDPRTGYGVTAQKNVTAIAKDGTTADWLSTACSILPVKKAKRLAKKLNADLVIAQMKKGRIEYYVTRNGEGDYRQD